MLNLKQTLLNYQSVFVLGLPTHETYRIFRSLLRDAVQDFMPVSYLDNGSKKTYILFNHDEDIAYVETNEGLLNLREGSNSVEKWEVIYLSVGNRNLPLGFVFVIPPQFKTKSFFQSAVRFIESAVRFIRMQYACSDGKPAARSAGQSLVVMLLQ